MSQDLLLWKALHNARWRGRTSPADKDQSKRDKTDRAYALPARTANNDNSWEHGGGGLGSCRRTKTTGKGGMLYRYQHTKNTNPVWTAHHTIDKECLDCNLEISLLGIELYTKIRPCTSQVRGSRCARPPIQSLLCSPSTTSRCRARIFLRFCLRA